MTPGPWKYSPVSSVVGSLISSPFYNIAAVMPQLDPGECEANARLIAAAPEHALVARLLVSGVMRWEPFQSCERGELCFNGLRHCTELDEFGIPRLTDHLRALIAKAEGGI